jgi:uncharacterized membrane protein
MIVTVIAIWLLADVLIIGLYSIWRRARRVPVPMLVEAKPQLEQIITEHLASSGIEEEEEEEVILSSSLGGLADA